MNKRALLAEDNLVNQTIIGDMMEELGWHVVIVDNGRAATEAALMSTFDVVLMDCDMPVLDGYAAASAIRHNAGVQGNECPPIIAVTTNNARGDRERCLEAGMHDHLPKPFTFEALRDMLESWGLEEPATAHDLFFAAAA